MWLSVEFPSQIMSQNLVEVPTPSPTSRVIIKFITEVYLFERLWYVVFRWWGLIVVHKPDLPTLMSIPKSNTQRSCFLETPKKGSYICG